MSNISICDFKAIAYMHSTFNTSICEIILNKYSNYHISYYSESKNNNAIQEIISDSSKQRIKFHALYFYRCLRILKPICVILNRLKSLKTHYHLSVKQKDVDIIFIICVSTLFLPLHVLLCKKNTYIFLHGEIEFLLKKDINIKAIIYKLIYKLSFLLSRKSIKYIVLSEIILNELKNCQKNINIVLLPHPIVNHKKIPLKKKNNQNIINIGFIGTISLNKGGREFFNLISSSKLYENIEFTATGACDKKIITLIDNLEISFKCAKSPTNYEEYINKINNLDYSIYLFSNGEYIYRISGTLMDSISLGIPIIALKNIYFEFLFKKYGDIGYLCNDMNDLKKLIEHMSINISYYKKRKLEQIKNILQIKNSFSIESLSSGIAL